MGGEFKQIWRSDCIYNGVTSLEYRKICLADSLINSTTESVQGNNTITKGNNTITKGNNTIRQCL